MKVKKRKVRKVNLVDKLGKVFGRGIGGITISGGVIENGKMIKWFEEKL